MDIASFVDRLPLNSYEKAAVVFLSSVESAAATLIVRHAKIPQGRVYSVLNSLRQKGLVEIVPSSPKRYLIRDVHATLRNYLAREKDILEQRQAEIAGIRLQRQLIGRPASTISYTGRDEHLQALAAMKDLARREVVQIAPLFIGSFATNLSLLRMLERGVKVRIIIREVTPQNRKVVEQAIKAGARIRRTARSDPLSIFIRDGEEVIFGVQDYRKDEERITIRTANQALLGAFASHFEREWSHSKPVRL